MATVTYTKQPAGKSYAGVSDKLIPRELTLTYDQIANAGAYATDDTFTATIPINAGEVVIGVGAKLVTAFAGSGDQLNMTVGDGTDADGFLTSAALHTSQSEITSVYNTGAYFNDGTTANTVSGKLYTADDTIDIVLDGTAGASIDLDDLTAGEVKITALILSLN